MEEIEKLKSLAYDLMVSINNSQQQLININNKIQQIKVEPTEEPAE